MGKRTEGTHGNVGQARDRVHQSSGPYWKRAHRSWWFWIGVVLMLTAITIYVLSDDLAFLPRFQPAGGVGRHRQIAIETDCRSGTATMKSEMMRIDLAANHSGVQTMSGPEGYWANQIYKRRILCKSK